MVAPNTIRSATAAEEVIALLDFGVPTLMSQILTVAKRDSQAQAALNDFVESVTLGDPSIKHLVSAAALGTISAHPALDPMRDVLEKKIQDKIHDTVFAAAGVTSLDRFGGLMNDLKSTVADKLSAETVGQPFIDAFRQGFIEAESQLRHSDSPATAFDQFAAKAELLRKIFGLPDFGA